MSVSTTSASYLVPFVRFYFTATPSDVVVDECVAIPGVKAMRARMGSRRPLGTTEAIQAPVNAAWRVEQLLTHYQTPFNLWRPKTVVQPLFDRPLTECGMRECDLETGKPLDEFLLPYRTYRRSDEQVTPTA